MIDSQPSEMEKSYRGFRIHIESDEACPFHPFTVTWDDDVARYCPIPAPMHFATRQAAYRTACQLIDVQYAAEAQSACQYFNPVAEPL